ncbi:MAG: hypothetical protein RIQ61_935 [Bacteroidota bacterium]|jgi:hypothetical protein
MKFRYFLVFVCCIGIFSCRKEELIAGKGGSASLSIIPQHHGLNIPNSKVYIKYNTKNTPSYYDDSVQTTMQNGIPTAVFAQLKKGNYYLYGTGFDTSVMQNVKGGIPYTIENETAQTIYLPITE